MGWFGDATDWAKEKWNSVTNLDRTDNQWAGQDQSNYQLPGAQYRDMLYQGMSVDAGNRQAPTAQAVTAADSDQRGRQVEAVDYFDRQMRGENLLSAEQLRQGQMSNVAAQQAFAASARPGQGAMAQRQAMANAARTGYGMSGQAAMAGIAERNAAAQNYSGALAGIRGQDLQLSQYNAGNRQNVNLANQGAQLQQMGLNDAQQRGLLGLQLQQAGMQQSGGIAYEGDRTNRFNAAMGVPTNGERALGAIEGGAQMYAASDERLKTDVADAGKDADEVMRSLKPVTWTYKDAKFGEGRHVGVMAQALEKTEGGKRAVVNTAEGKMLHPGKLSGLLAAAVARLNERLAKVEGK